jgi:hypothetical protein
MVHDFTEGFLDDLSSCSQTRITVKGYRKCQLADDLTVGGNDCDRAKLPCVLSIGYNMHTSSRTESLVKSRLPEPTQAV